MNNERAPALTPPGNHVLDQFMAAKMRRCPHCGAAPLFPCVVQVTRLAGLNGVPTNTSKPRAHFHQARYK